MIWPEEEKTKLRELSANGLTARQIAERLGNGRTRNAVISAWHRGGIKPIAVPKRSTRAKMIDGAREQMLQYTGVASRADRTPLLGKAWEVLPNTTPASLVDRTGCWWPVGPSDPQMYCDDKQDDRSHYCRHHHLLSLSAAAREKETMK